MYTVSYSFKFLIHVLILINTSIFKILIQDYLEFCEKWWEKRLPAIMFDKDSDWIVYILKLIN
jgi:hypothetical protein